MNQNQVDFDEIDIQEELGKDFVFFVNHTHKKLNNSEFNWEDYSDSIVEDLMKVFRLELLFLFINIPPRLGKTTLLTYFFAWTMYRDGRVYNNYYSYSDLLINKFYSTITSIFKIGDIAEGADTAYKRTKEDYSNSIGGGVFAQTTLGQVTGFGAGRKEDVHIFNGAIGIDDPHKAQDSMVRIMSANKAIKSAILNRKNNARVPIIFIMQRLYRNDATGFFMNLYREHFKTNNAKLLKLSVINKKGESIAPKEYPLYQLAIERENDQAYFYAQLMQEPQFVDGKCYKERHFEMVENLQNKKCSITVSFDPENTSQPIVFIAFRKEGKDAIISDYIEESFEADSFFTALKDFAKVNNAKDVYIPKNLITDSLQQEILPYKVKEVKEHKDIDLSAFYSVGLLRGGKIKLKNDDMNEAFKDELKLFPNAERDYTVRATVNVLEILFIKSGGRMGMSL